MLRPLSLISNVRVAAKYVDLTNKVWFFEAS